MKVGQKRKLPKNLTIRQYLEKYCPEGATEIERDARLAAEEIFNNDTKIKTVVIPFFTPDFPPIISYVIYNRDLKELSSEGEIIND